MNKFNFSLKIVCLPIRICLCSLNPVFCLGKALLGNMLYSLAIPSNNPLFPRLVWAVELARHEPNAFGYTASSITMILGCFT